MKNLILFILVITNEKTIEIKFSPIGPKIDGCIEEIWHEGDSAYNFVQSLPYEKSSPTDETLVYFLQDSDNIYIAFRCFTKNSKTVNRMSAKDDAVALYLDTFNSKRESYAFVVYISGSHIDGIILDDRRSADDSWDGVWFYKVKTFSDRYEVKIKIPFKSITI